MAYNNQNSCNNSIQITPDSNAVLRITNNTKKSISIVDVATGQIFDVNSGCVINIKNINGKPITKISVIRTVDCGKKCKGCNNVTIQNLTSTAISITDAQLNATKTVSLPGNTTTNISNKITNNEGQFCAIIDMIVVDSSGSSIGAVIVRPNQGSNINFPDLLAQYPLTSGSLTLSANNTLSGSVSGTAPGSTGTQDQITVAFNANGVLVSGTSPVYLSQQWPGTYTVLGDPDQFTWTITSTGDLQFTGSGGQTINT